MMTRFYHRGECAMTKALIPLLYSISTHGTSGPLMNYSRKGGGIVTIEGFNESPARLV
jgi:hypothetical protein